jgi:hypothetical protein
MRQTDYLAGHLVSTLPDGKWLELWNMKSDKDIRSHIGIDRPNTPYRSWNYETIRCAMKMLVDIGYAEYSRKGGKHLWRVCREM